MNIQSHTHSTQANIGNNNNKEDSPMEKKVRSKEQYSDTHYSINSGVSNKNKTNSQQSKSDLLFNQALHMMTQQTNTNINQNTQDNMNYIDCLPILMTYLF